MKKELVTRSFIEATIDHVIFNGAKIKNTWGGSFTFPQVANSAELAECIVATLRKNGVVVMMQEELDEKLEKARHASQV